MGSLIAILIPAAAWVCAQDEHLHTVTWCSSRLATVLGRALQRALFCSEAAWTVSCTGAAQGLMAKPLLVGAPPADGDVVTQGEGDDAVLPAVSAQVLQEPNSDSDNVSPSRDTVFQGGASVNLEEI